MAKITKKQEEQFSRLTVLFHALIGAKHNKQRTVFEDTIAQIREVVKEEEDVDTKK